MMFVDPQRVEEYAGSCFVELSCGARNVPVLPSGNLRRLNKDKGLFRLESVLESLRRAQSEVLSNSHNQNITV